MKNKKDKIINENEKYVEMFKNIQNFFNTKNVDNIFIDDDIQKYFELNHNTKLVKQSKDNIINKNDEEIIAIINRINKISKQREESLQKNKFSKNNFYFDEEIESNIKLLKEKIQEIEKLEDK
ncbi:hypothetical protein [Metamycoplasma orale]|uniref:Uncharacterized protein n=1 Tax=Metamycoplasma orale TaxID=2121 RepID=A0A448ZV89_METOS|nr:hypothetical protein [Metamycoplasma orale]VEU55154.1 Uncharacterised protein [Metamycoplasma orale]